MLMIKIYKRFIKMMKTCLKYLLLAITIGIILTSIRYIISISSYHNETVKCVDKDIHKSEIVYIFKRDIYDEYVEYVVHYDDTSNSIPEINDNDICVITVDLYGNVKSVNK